MNRLDEIEVRMAEIAAELDTPDADVDALETEVRSLKDERKRIMTDLHKRQAIRQEVADGKGDVVKRLMTEPEKKRTFALDTPEYRTAFLKSLQGKPMSVEERAAVTASAVIPTQTMNLIVGRFDVVPTIAAVDVMYICLLYTSSC